MEVRAGGGAEGWGVTEQWFSSFKREREGSLFFPFALKPLKYLISHPPLLLGQCSLPPLTSNPQPLPLRQALPDLSPAARPPFRASWTPLTSGLPGSRALVTLKRIQANRLRWPRAVAGGRLKGTSALLRLSLRLSGRIWRGLTSAGMGL